MTCKNIRSYTKCLLLKYAQQIPSIFDTEQNKAKNKKTMNVSTFAVKSFFN